VAACSDIIFLGVKPQNMPQVLAALAPHVGPHHLIISIAAGVTLPTYEAALPEGTRVIRIMPNTPMLVQRGASAYCLGRWATEEDEQKLNVLLRPTGLVVPVEEKMMDAVTGLSGSGPAFVYMMIEAMADGGVLAGLPRERALQLAAQTVAGAAHMVMEACEDGELAHPGECEQWAGVCTRLGCQGLLLICTMAAVLVHHMVMAPGYQCR
jgi:pyrroline-5-carboxylate reductase